MQNKLFTLSKICFLFSLTLFLSSCTSKPTTQDITIEQQIYSSDNKLFYLGEITHAKNSLLAELYRSHQNINLLEINSPGGDVIAGLELGNWVLDNNLDVRIGAICASSCANYVFPAGNKKILQEHSLLLWHGSSYQSDVDELVNSGDSFTNKWRRTEEAFFKKVRIDHLITTCGLSQAPIGARILHNLNIINLKGFDYSITDLKKFGIDGLVLPEGNWLGTTKFSLKGVFRADYCSSKHHH